VGTRTPGTLKKTPRAAGATVATPHTARAVKQLQLTVGRSGGVKSTRNRPELRRESQRDVLRAVSRGLAKEVPSTRGTTTRVTRAGGARDDSSPSLSPPDLQARLESPSSDDIPAPRMSLSHDPLAPTRTIHRTPPSAQRGDTSIASIEAARRAPLTRLSDRMSFGAADDVDDTMMNILAQRVDLAPFGDDDDDDEMFDMAPMGMGEYSLYERRGG
jgi:hypothetical protein